MTSLSRAGARTSNSGTSNSATSNAATSSTPQDAALIKQAARRVGVQVAAASALAVTIAGILAFTLIRRHGGTADIRTVPGGYIELSSDRDALVLNALIIAAVLGIFIAGFVGALIARRAVRPLAQALALQRRFVADAGHELRTPLTVLHTRAQLLARKLTPNDPARLIADELLDDSRMLGEIVDELLLSASMSVHPGLAEEFDAADLLGDVVHSLQVIAADSRVTLTVEAGPTIRLRGSRSALRRAVIALVDNAISHSGEGGTVRLTARDLHGRTTLTVADQGPGLAQVDDGVMWGRFSRGPDDGTAAVRAIGNRRYGLGLALVREIATAHGGTITLENAAAGEPGAVATLSLPGV